MNIIRELKICILFFLLSLVLNLKSQPVIINRNINLSTPTLTLEVKSNNVVISENVFVYINATPAMPVLRATVKSTSNIVTSIEIKFSIQFIKYYNNNAGGTVVRNESSNYPNSGYRIIKSNEEWNVNSEMENDFRGGKATIAWKLKGSAIENQFVFYIRGTNPTTDEIKTELGNTPWFLKNLCYQESSYNQFNPEDPGIEWVNSGKCPNWGPPDGWGLMQRDPPPSESFLWNWKVSIQLGKEFLNGEKYNIANSRYSADMDAFNRWNLNNPDDQKVGHADQVEGNTTFAHSPTGNERSFFDAMWIKSYNGNSGGTDGYPGYYYIWKNQGADANNPYWDLHRTNSDNHNYVEAVCSQNQ